MLVDFFTGDCSQKAAKFGRKGVVDIVVVFVGVWCHGRWSHISRQVDLPDRGNKGNDFDAVDLLEIPFGYGTCSHSPWLKAIPR